MATSPSTFAPSAPLARLMDRVRAAAQKNTSVDWGAVLANAPLLVLTYGIVQLSTEDVSALATTAMPDDWVQAAAALPTVSTKNLRKLQQAFDSKGFVSITAADRFCTVEFARERQLAEQAARDQAINASAGYNALTTRLAGDGFEPTFDEAMAALKGYAALGATKAGAGLVALTVEAADAARRQVDVAAGVFVKLRNQLGRD